MSNEGQAPPPGGFPPHGEQQAPHGAGEDAQSGQAPQSGYGQPAPYQQPQQQPGQWQGQPGGYAPAPGQQAPAPGSYGQQPHGTAPQAGPYPPGVQPGAYPTGSQPGAYAPAPVAPRPNPFAGIPTSDFVRDAISALLLLVSFALPVTLGFELEGVGDRFHFVVTLVTVLSVASLTLPYLARAGVFPPTWTVHTTRLVRMLANAPYAVVVLVYVVLDAVTSDETTGVGTIFALGLAGAVLAAQPRQCEMGPEDLDRGVSKLWWTITAGIGAFIALTYVVSLVLFLIEVGDFADFFGATLAIGAILAWIFSVVFSLWAIYGTVVLRSPSWRLVLIGIGAILVCSFVFGAGDGSSLLKIESLRVFGLSIVHPLSLQEGLGAIFVPAAAAAAAAPATLRALNREPQSRTWVMTAVHGLDYIAFVAGVTVISAALWFFLDGDERPFLAIVRPTGVLVTTIVLGLVILGAAVYARLGLVKDPSGNRVLALAAAGAAFVLGLVIIILVPQGTYGEGKYVTVGHLALAFGLPVLVTIALTVPKSVREYFAANRPAPRGATNAAYQWTAPQGQAPGYQYPGQPGAYPGQPGAPAGYGTAPQAQQPYGAPAQPGAWQTQGAASGYSQPAPQAPQPQPSQSAPQATHDAAQPESAQPHTAQQAAAQSDTSRSETEQSDAAQSDAAQSHAAASDAATEGVTQPLGLAKDESAARADAVQTPATSGFTAAQALDPNTPGAVLAQIVQDTPELRAQVAANPSTYPALLGWLAQLGDPEVDAALRSRQG